MGEREGEGGRGRVGVGLSEDGKRKEEPSSYGSPARSYDRYSCYIIYTLPLHVSTTVLVIVPDQWTKPHPFNKD